jgi:hypothetical protein
MNIKFLENTRSSVKAKPARIVSFLGFALVMAAASSSVSAARYWPPVALSDWTISLNNGLVYISSPQIASQCIYGRGEIRVSDSAYNRALYAYALSAQARGKSLRYVVDDTATLCVIDALEEI